MKRSPMPPRKTPLKSSGSSPVARKPSKPGKHVGESKARKDVKDRSGGLCEIREPGCFNAATDWHHRKLKGQGGPWDVTNGLHLCRFCHDLVTNTRGRRKEFERYGWLVPSHEDPSQVECLIYTRWYGHDYVKLLGEYPWVELAEFPVGDPRHPDDIDREEPCGLDGGA